MSTGSGCVGSEVSVACAWKGSPVRLAENNVWNYAVCVYVSELLRWNKTIANVTLR